jgi:hypothetical protein
VRNARRKTLDVLVKRLRDLRSARADRLSENLESDSKCQPAAAVNCQYECGQTLTAERDTFLPGSHILW